MLKEALQYILDGMRPETQDLCGRAYVITPSGAQEVIETPIVPATLQLHSLDSIVKMIRTEAIHLADANTPALFVNIPSPTNVTCFSQPDFTQRCAAFAQSSILPAQPMSPDGMRRSRLALKKLRLRCVHAFRRPAIRSMR